MVSSIEMENAPIRQIVLLCDMTAAIYNGDQAFVSGAVANFVKDTSIAHIYGQAITGSVQWARYTVICFRMEER